MHFFASVLVCNAQYNDGSVSPRYFTVDRLLLLIVSLGNPIQSHKFFLSLHIVYIQYNVTIFPPGE